jgi:outer membrane protein insertion porin family|tara:strand:+ start:3869 stop:5725 length:1857 start_codon:yes stop_codon:yes gene_type:complete
MLHKYYLTILLTTISFSQISERRIISNVFFIGNGQVNSSELEDQIELKPPSVMSFNSIDFDRRLLKLDAINIKNFYNSKGFLEASIKDSFDVVNNKVDIFFLINEGTQYFLKDVNIEGLKSLNNDEILSNLGLFKGQPYNPISINKKLSIIDELLQERGKIFAAIDVDQLIQDSVEIKIKVDEGKRVYINNSWISGAERIDTLFVRKEIVFENGKVFDKRKIEKSKRNLLEVGFFTSANIIAHPIFGRDTLVNLEVKVREFKNVGETALEFGLDEIEYVPGVRSLVGLGGSINWTDRMILGTKNRFETDGSVVLPTEDGFIFPRFGFDVKISNQRPFSLKFPTQIKLFFQQFKNFGDEYGPYVRRFGFQYSNIFRWNRQRSFIDFGLTFERFDEFAALSQDIEQRKFKFHLNQDNRDNPLDPKNGNMVIFRLDAYGGPLGGNRSYTKYSLDLRNYITFFKNITLASRINGGFISGWSNDYDQYETILFEKFYLGGSNTLRAIRPLRLLNYNNDKFDNDGDGLIDEEDEDSNIPTGTEIMTLTNIEVRFPIMWKLGGVLFFDGGNVYLDSKNIRFDSLVWNYGLALTLNLPVGPIRIDYARDSLNPKIYQIQLGFLYAF